MATSGQLFRRGALGFVILGASSLLVAACGGAPARAAAAAPAITAATPAALTLPGPSTALAIPQRAVSGFPSPVAAALRVVAAGSKVPLLAPTRVEAGLSAKTVGKGGGYVVALDHCSQVLPVNNPNIGEAGPTGDDCGGLAQLVGGFGGQPLPTTKSLLLTGSAAGPPSSSGTSITSLKDFLTPSSICEPSMTSARVSLGDGVKGVLIRSAGTACELTWSERGWTVDVDLNMTGTSVASLPDASQIVTLMRSVRLPASQGLVSILNGGDGEHTTILWISGHALYFVSDYHHASGAIDMLGSVATAFPG